MKNFNKVEIGGRIYDFKLDEIENNGVSVIKGVVTVEVEEGENPTLVDVQFYSPEIWKSGKKNSTYHALKNIVDGELTSVVEDGDDADWINITGSMDANWFAPRNEVCNSIDDLRCSQRVRGAFINSNTRQTYTNKWTVDAFLTNIIEIEEDVERDIPASIRIPLFYVDDYNSRVMKASIDAVDEAPMNYLRSLPELTQEEPMYLSIKGCFKTRTSTIVREGAFGDPEVTSISKTIWALTWMAKNSYDFFEVEEDYKKFLVGWDTYRDEQLAKGTGSEKDELVF